MKNLVLVVLVLAAGVGVWLALGSGDSGPARIDGPGHVASSDEPDSGAPAAAVQSGTDVPPDPGRIAAPRENVSGATSSGEEFAQGVMGRVVDPSGRPVIGASAFLMEGQGANVFENMILYQKGIRRPVLAQTDTDESGVFHLGVAKLPAGRNYEIRFVASQYADQARAPIALFPEKWWDCGNVTMQPGIVLSGRVLDAMNGGPIEGAEIAVKTSSAGLSLTVTPGREDGLVAITDSSGTYRFDNVPAGVHTISAVATGFARLEKPNVSLTAEQMTTHDFELPPGLSIAGVVVDANGQPIAGANIQAFSITAKTPSMTKVAADTGGRFEAIGLVEGPYQLTIDARGYVSKNVKPIMAGEQDEQIVLEQQGGAQLRVLAKNGRLMQRYQVLIKTWIPDQDMFGNLLDKQAIKVFPRDLDGGVLTVSGLNPGRQYGFEVNAPGYAKTYSEPFEIAVNGDEPFREVRLSKGGSLVGSIVDDGGQALAGAAVTTMPNYLEDNTLTAMFGAMIPYRISKASVRTNRGGRFELDLLAPGTYKVKVEHPDHYTLYLSDLEVVEDQETDVGATQMQVGCQVRGSVTVDGTPAAQIKVQVGAVHDPNAEQQNSFSAFVVSDDRGEFVIPQRLRPGSYQASAGRQGNPFQMVVDYSKTKQEFVVGFGLREYVLQFAIQSQ